MGIFEFFWDYNQEQRINAAHSAIGRSDSNIETTQRALEELRAAVGHLILVNRALWEILSEKTGVSEGELKARIDEIDLRDGALDGLMGPDVVPCPSCNRVNSPRRKLCLYCGKRMDGSSPP